MSETLSLPRGKRLLIREGGLNDLVDLSFEIWNMLTHPILKEFIRKLSSNAVIQDNPTRQTTEIFILKVKLRTAESKTESLAEVIRNIDEGANNRLLLGFLRRPVIPQRHF